jgi:tetratricopeptide (TPR) repeat protein
LEQREAPVEAPPETRHVKLKTSILKNQGLAFRKLGRFSCAVTAFEKCIETIEKSFETIETSEKEASQQEVHQCLMELKNCYIHNGQPEMAEAVELRRRAMVQNLDEAAAAVAPLDDSENEKLTEGEFHEQGGNVKR